MTRSQLIAAAARKTDNTAKTVENILDTFVDEIIDCLARGESVTITGLGRFEMRQRQPKRFVNPKTKEARQLAPRSIPAFKASGKLKKMVDEYKG